MAGAPSQATRINKSGPEAGRVVDLPEGELLIGFAGQKKNVHLVRSRVVQNGNRIQLRRDPSAKDAPIHARQDQLSIVAGRAVQRLPCDGAVPGPGRRIGADQHRSLKADGEPGAADELDVVEP